MKNGSDNYGQYQVHYIKNGYYYFKNSDELTRDDNK